MKTENGVDPKGSVPSLLRFGCTACGQCCTRGPEMELSEATALSDVFTTRLLFRVHAVPNDIRAPGAESWLRFEGSSATPQRAILDAHQHAALFSAGREIDGGWTRYFVISALPIQEPSERCPALHTRECRIYDRRPLSCRSAPLHYSRPLSTLGRQIERFTVTPHYECDTSAEAPIILEGSQIQIAEFKAARKEAAALHAREKKWRKKIVDATKATGATRHHMPRHDDILFNSRNGHATSVTMASAWAVAVEAEILSKELVAEVYANQVKLISAAIATTSDANVQRQLCEMLTEYENELSAHGTLDPGHSPRVTV